MTICPLSTWNGRYTPLLNKKQTIRLRPQRPHYRSNERKAGFDDWLEDRERRLCWREMSGSYAPTLVHSLQLTCAAKRTLENLEVAVGQFERPVPLKSESIDPTARNQIFRHHMTRDPWRAGSNHGVASGSGDLVIAKNIGHVGMHAGVLRVHRNGNAICR